MSRILIITHAFLPDVDGGIIVANDYANILTELGHTVTVMSKTYANPIKNTLFKYVQVPNYFGEYFWMYNYGWFLRTFSLDKFDYIILNQCPSAAIAGHFFDQATLSKCIPILQGAEIEWVYQNKKTLSNFFYNKILRMKYYHQKCLQYCKKIVSVSQFHKNKIIQSGDLNHLATKFQIVYTGIDKSIFHNTKSNYKEILGIENKTVLITVSRIEVMKGFKEMLHIYKRLIDVQKSFVWIIIGNGPYMQELSMEILNLGLSKAVILIGLIEREKLAAYYSLADCFWLLSNYDECLPLVYLEAQACGVPAIGRRKGGVMETILDRETGFLVKDEQECFDILYNNFFKKIDARNCLNFAQRFDKVKASRQLISSPTHIN